MGEFDNAKMYRIFGFMHIAFYLINTYYYAVIYVIAGIYRIKGVQASKVKNSKKERKREENGEK